MYLHYASTHIFSVGSVISCAIWRMDFLNCYKEELAGEEELLAKNIASLIKIVIFKFSFENLGSSHQRPEGEEECVEEGIRRKEPSNMT